jgi:hypothetical protein
MMSIQRVERIKSSYRLPIYLGVLGGLIYLILSVYFAHTQVSIIDEGAYLLKGYLFATGKYEPFQDYGPYTNHMPLSFLIPGWVQVIFGPGLRTGRYLAIVCGLGMLLGIWRLSTRLANHWWGAIMIWLVALNAPVLRVYSVMTSQVLVSCILVWILVFILRPPRPRWQIYLGVVLAGILLLTRINLSPVLPLVIVYIFWEHGKKAGLWASVIGILVVGFGHVPFWPDILKIWAVWSPIDFPFLQAWKAPAVPAPLWSPEINLMQRITSFLLSLRIHFTVLVGLLMTILMWPRKKSWRSEWQFRSAVFLGFSFLLLYIIHARASLGKNYCVYCLPNYVMFFQLLGLFFVFFSFSSWRTFSVHFKKWLSLPLMFAVSIGVGYSLIFGRQLIATWIGGRLFNFVNLLWHTEIPRFREGSFMPGSGPLWGIFESKFGWTEKGILNISLLIIFLVLSWILMFYVARLFERRLGGLTNVQFSSNAVLMMVFLIIGSIFTIRTGFLTEESDCSWDVIASYEAAGTILAETVEPGSKIYWRGESAVLLLYPEEYEIYPPQINGDYTYFLAGNPDVLVRYGRWNPELSIRWQQDADVLLIEESKGDPDVDFYGETILTPPTHPCDPDSAYSIYVWKR